MFFCVFFYWHYLDFTKNEMIMMRLLNYKSKKWFLITCFLTTERPRRLEIARIEDTDKRGNGAVKRKVENRREGHVTMKQRLEWCGHKQRNAGRGKKQILPESHWRNLALLTSWYQPNDTDFRLLTPECDYLDSIY